MFIHFISKFCNSTFCKLEIALGLFLAPNKNAKWILRQKPHFMLISKNFTIVRFIDKRWLCECSFGLTKNAKKLGYQSN